MPELYEVEAWRQKAPRVGSIVFLTHSAASTSGSAEYTLLCCAGEVTGGKWNNIIFVDYQEEFQPALGGQI